jgi:starch phosphorylase
MPQQLSDRSTRHPDTATTGEDAAHGDILAAFRAALEMTRAEAASSSGDAPAARAALRAAADVCRGLLAERWAKTQAADAQRSGPMRRVHYLSMEFLMGRALRNALAALGLEAELAAEFGKRGLSLADALEAEPDAALGNGGLGRLAACFLDAFAETGLPSFGYGLRYRYGMFAQATQDGRQIEQPDDWLRHGALWDAERLDVEFMVGFGGRVESDGAGGRRWLPAERIVARADRFRRLLPRRLRRRLAPSNRRRRAELGALPRRQHRRRPRTALEARSAAGQRFVAGFDRPPPRRRP